MKNNRDYMQNRMHSSWQYLSHLAAKREYSYLKALHEHDFPVPKPIDINRHAVLMEYVDALPLSQVSPTIQCEKYHIRVVLPKLYKRLRTGACAHNLQF